MENKIKEIEFIINNKLKSEKISLFTGLSGIILFYCELISLYPDNDSYKNRFFNLVEELFDKINKENYNLFYCDGLTGVAHLLIYLNRNNLLEEYDISEFLKDVEELLLNHLLKPVLNINNIDMLHGNLGIIYYILFSRSDLFKTENSKYLKNTINAIDNHINEIKFNENNKELVNFGLSHGLASYLIITSKLFNENKDPFYQRIIESILNVYLYFENHSSGNSIFPSQAYSLKEGNYNVNLGWCYGDQTISYAIFYASKAIGNRFWIEKSIEYAQLTIPRNTIDKALSKNFDYMFCHGVTSVAYMNKKWFQITANQMFLDNYNDFMEEILKINEYKRYDSYTSNYVESFGLLDGISGVGVFLINHILENDSIDRFFFLK